MKFCRIYKLYKSGRVSRVKVLERPDELDAHSVENLL